MLTKPRDPSKMLQSSMYDHRKQRRSPLLLVGISVTVLIALIVVGVTVVLPRLSASHAATAAVPNPNCTLVVPPNPLTAQGLATPYQLVATDPAAGPCNEANPAQSAFVQAAILDQATGKVSIYAPLVIDQGTQPAIPPVAVQLPARAVVGIWFGFNANMLTLLKNNAKNRGRNAAMGRGNRGHMALRGGMVNGNCVNGIANSVFGQFAYCNAPTFFQAANRAIQAGQLTIPALGMATDGQPCFTSRDFGMVDQDQSDNVQTQYLTNANGQTAQFSAANQAQLANATKISNPSDNALLTRFLDPALGCQPVQAPDLTDNNNMVSALPLDELQAAANQAAPAALIPANDPMVLNNANQDLNKVNAYRRGVDQTPAASINNDANGTTYCQNLVKIALPRLQLDMANFQQQASPDGGATANSLFTFLANRLNGALGDGNLNCTGLLNIQNPVTLTTDGNGVVTAATITNPPLAVGAGAGTGTGTTTTNTATGTVNAILDTNAGTAQVALNLNIANFANMPFTVTITDSATGTQLLQQAENTDANGANAASTVINNLQGLAAIPNTWVATVTDANGNTLGSATFVSNGATAVATLTATSTTTTGTGTGTTTGTGTGTTTTGTGTTATTNTATGTVNAILDTNAGSAQVALNLNIANFANQQFTVTITDSATGTQLLQQAENTDANGANVASTVINNLQGLAAIPNTWVATVTDANGNTLGSATFVSNGATAVATLTGTAAGAGNANAGGAATGNGNGNGNGHGGKKHKHH